MSMDKRELLVFNITNAINREFFPEIEVLAIDVTPDYGNRLWEIYIEFRNPYNKDRIQSTTIYTKDLSQKLSFEYETIIYIEENLYNWCRIKQSDMNGKFMKYDANRLSWVWGKYDLINFNSSDPYFDQILELVNG